MIKGHLASGIIELHQTYSRVNTVEPQSAVADALIPGKCLVQFGSFIILKHLCHCQTIW